MEKGLSPHPETWNALFKGARKTEDEGGKEAEAMSQSEQQERLLKVLLYMRNNQIYPQHGLANTIKTWFERCEREMPNWLRGELRPDPHVFLFDFIHHFRSIKKHN